MQVVLNVKGSSRTTGSGHNREVVALCRWPCTRTGSTVINITTGNINVTYY